MPEPIEALDPDERFVPDVARKPAEPVHLSGGGTLHITRQLDAYSLSIEWDGGSLHVPLSFLDVMGVRSLSGDLIVARVNQQCEEREHVEALLANLAHALGPVEPGQYFDTGEAA